MSQNIFYKGNIYINCPSLPLRQDCGYYGEYEERLEKFEKKLSEIVFYPYRDNDLKEGQVVVEGMHYKLQYQISHPETGAWYNFDKKYYDRAISSRRRIVAVQKDQTIEVKKEETPHETIARINKELHTPEPSTIPVVDYEKEAEAEFPYKDGLLVALTNSKREGYIHARQMSSPSDQKLKELIEWINESDKLVFSRTEIFAKANFLIQQK